MLPTCIVIGCINSIHNQTVKYYKVPIDNSNICRQWYINTLREDLEPSNNHYICIEHFDEESFLQQQQNEQHNDLNMYSSNNINNNNNLSKNNQMLKEDAVPSLFEIEVFQKMIQHQELVSNGNRSISNSIQSIDLQAITDLSSSILTTQQQQHHQQQQQTLLENLLINDNSNNKMNRQQQQQQQNYNRLTTNGSSNLNSANISRCSVKTCVNSSNVSTMSLSSGTNDTVLYSLPKAPEIAKKWMIACQSHDNELKLCREHFVQSDFNEYNYLKPDAVPSIFVNNRNIKTQNNNDSMIIDGSNSSVSISSAKRARMDPDTRAELMTRIPKALKRTTIQSLINNNNNNNNSNPSNLINNTKNNTNNNNNNNNSNANKIQKALKHTNSIINNNRTTSSGLQAHVEQSHQHHLQQQQMQNTNSKFLSAALNNSQTIIAPLKPITTIPASSKQLNNNLNANKAQKAVKHTTAASLLKDILPPPIMQSTKRTPRAVKHTNSIISSGNSTNTTTSNSSIVITSIPSTVVSSNQRTKQPTTQINNQQIVSNSSIIISSIKNDSLTQQQHHHHVGNESTSTTTSTNNNNITHKTTYVYKKITQQPEIELYLECEDDEQQIIETPKATNSIELKDKLEDNSTDKAKLNANSNKIKEKVVTINSTVNAKPIGSILNVNSQQQHKLTARQQQLNLQKLPIEKRYIQILLKYYSRIDDNKIKSAENSNDSKKKTNYPAKCNICEKHSGNNIDFISHICSHLEGDSYVSPFEAVCTTCSVCDKQFKNPFDLIIHLDTDHLKEISEFKCRICEHQHKDLDELLSHLNTMHSINEMPYHCDVCDFRTSFYADAIYHIKTIHKDTLYSFCPYCLKSFLLPHQGSHGNNNKVQHAIVNSFYSHLVTHFDKRENNKLIESKCKHCLKCILHVRFMKEHLNNDHNTNSISTHSTSLDAANEGLFIFILCSLLIH